MTEVIVNKMFVKESIPSKFTEGTYCECYLPNFNTSTGDNIGKCYFAYDGTLEDMGDSWRISLPDDKKYRIHKKIADDSDEKLDYLLTASSTVIRSLYANDTACFEKDIVILTKSRKYHNYCVAGIDIHTGKWVRLVTDLEDIHGAVRSEDLRFEDGREAQILDVVRVKGLTFAGTDLQPENMVLSALHRMQFVNHMSLDEVLALHPAEIRPYLYGNTRPSSTVREIAHVDYSLTLVKVVDMNIHISRHESGKYTKMKVTADFIYNGRRYKNIRCTDQDYEQESLADTTQYFSSAYLIVSIGAAWSPSDDHEPLHYKFIAKIFDGNE